MTPKRVRTVEGSCWACKDRRVLCDLQRPQCSRCSSEDHPCEYGKLRLRWCNGVAARGRFAGQNVPVSSRGDDDGDGGGGDGSLVRERGKKRLLPQKEKRYRRSVDVQVSPLLSSQSMTFSPSSSLGFVSEKNSVYDAGYEQDEDVDDDEEEGEEEEEEEECRDDQETDYQQQMECQSSFELLKMPALITADHLMLYFEKIVIDRFNLAAKPFTVDLGSVYQQPALRYSATAVANAHQQLSYCPQRQDTFLSKKTARLKAIHNFRTQLESPTQTPRSPHQSPRRSSLALDLFIANVLLCILDGVVDPNDENAACQVHYRGGRAILSQLKIPQRILLQQRQGLPALMLSCFATMDLTYSLLSGAEQFFQHTAWAYFAGSDGWWGVLRPGDPFLGIMRILSRLAQMGHVVRSGVNASIFEEELESLEASLRGFPSPLSSSSTHSFGESDSSSFLLPLYHEQSCSNLDDKSHPQQQSLLAPYLLAPMISTTYQLDHDQSWAIFCNAYRLTGLIYIYRVFRGLNPMHPLIQEATSYGLRAICEPRLRGKLAHCLLFPGLVIGAHCRTPAQQKANLAAMRSTAAFLSFGSLSVMENFLHELWRRNLAEESGSESWWECFQSISVQTFLF